MGVIFPAWQNKYFTKTLHINFSLLFFTIIVAYVISIIVLIHFEYDEKQTQEDKYNKLFNEDQKLKEANKKLREKLKDSGNSSDQRIKSLEDQLKELSKKVSSIEQTKDNSSMKLTNYIKSTDNDQKKSTIVGNTIDYGRSDDSIISFGGKISSDYYIDKNELIHSLKGDNKSGK